VLQEHPVRLFQIRVHKYPHEALGRFKGFGDRNR
jgi:hypothetical protein